MADLTQARLKELLNYDPETGVFTARVQRGRLKAGDVCGGDDGGGYRFIGVDNERYLEHRLAWFWMTGEWPPHDVDHRELRRGNNRFAGLRSATRSQNMQNIRRHRDNTSGFKGVSWHKEKKRWRATIQINGAWKFLGYFDDPAEAHSAYARTAAKHFGEFARS